MSAIKHMLQRLGLFKISISVYVWTLALRLLALRILTRKPLLVLFRAGGLGDIIATVPSIRALRRTFPDRLLVYCTRPDFAEIGSLVPEIQRTLAVYHSDRAAEFCSRFYDVRNFKYQDELVGHASRENFAEEMAQSVGASYAKEDAVLHVSPLSQQELVRFLGPGATLSNLIALHTGPTCPVREWEPDRWQELVNGLLTIPGLTILKAGRDSHFLMGDKPRVDLKGTASCQREMTLVDTARLLQSCRLFIGVDSGLLHLAAAVGTPTVALFGPVDPVTRSPQGCSPVTAFPRLPCQFCHHHQPRGHWMTGCPQDKACMRAITVNQVLNAASAQLKKNKPNEQTF